MKIAIAGYGVEGEASYRYYANDPSNDITIFEQNPAFVGPEGVKTVTGSDAFQQLVDFDLVLRSPSIPPQHIQTNGKVWSGTNEFFAKCTADIIGVTGSKGKGTTASFIAAILEAAGRKVWLVGNIGKPALDILDQIQPEDIVVYELSSFQLWDIERSPKTAVILFIEQEHLDVHKDMAEYVAVKGNITRYQTPSDLLIYNAENEYSRGIAELSVARKVGYPSGLTTHIQDGFFYNGEQKMCSIDAVQLPGAHNLSNAIAAIDATWLYTQDPEVIEAGLRAFRGLPHRLAFVRSVGGVKYYDDSIATTPTSAIAALRAFDGKKVIILGGSSKGSDFTELAEELLHHDVRAVLIGAEAETLAKTADLAGFKDYEIITNPTMEKIVTRATELADNDAVVLLSPAAASFGLFENYDDRGAQYIAAVEAL